MIPPPAALDMRLLFTECPGRPHEWLTPANPGGNPDRQGYLTAVKLLLYILAGRGLLFSHLSFLLYTFPITLTSSADGSLICSKCIFTNGLLLSRKCFLHADPIRKMNPGHPIGMEIALVYAAGFLVC